MELGENTLKLYIEEIRKKPVLTREEENNLFKRLRAGDESARQEIIEANLRFVVKIALQFMGKGLSLADLIQEGNIGLMAVINKFDWRRGYRFSTYAAFWIKQNIQLAILRYNSLVKLPLRKARLMGRLTEFINNFWLARGREPTENELAEGIELEREKLDVVQQWRDSILSLDAHPNDSTDSVLYDFVASSNTKTPEEIFAEEEREEKINSIFGSLSEREERVLRLRYGFGGKEPLSLRKASKIIGLSQEGVRKIEKRALEKLRRPPLRAQLVGLL